MKKNIFLFVLLASTIHLHGQTLDFSKLEGRWDTTRTVQYESAQYQIAYEYKYARDAKHPDAKRTATTILRVGSRYTMFTMPSWHSILFLHLLQRESRLPHPLVRNCSVH